MTHKATIVRDSIVSDLFRGIATPEHDDRCTGVALATPKETPYDRRSLDAAYDAAMLSWVARSNVPPGFRFFGPPNPKYSRLILGYAICKATDLCLNDTMETVKLARKVTALHIRNKRQALRDWNARKATA
jgi:hypothetical protein